VTRARTLFTGGSVFDGTGSPPRDADVLVEDGRILDVGAGLDGDEAVDVRGRTLLPGLFDCHTHVFFDHRETLDDVRAMELPFSYRFFQAARHLEATLRQGVTTIRDGAGADLGVKRAVEDGLIAGPRMQIAITMLSQTGGHGDHWMPCGGVFPRNPPHPGRPSGLVDGVDEVRRKVRELIRDGADVIKVATSGGALSPTDDPRGRQFSDEELEVAVREAAAAQRHVMAHAQGTEGIKAAVRAGVRSVEHGTFIDDEGIEMMLERGTWLVPTLSAPHGVLDAAAEGVPVPEYAVAKTKEMMAAHRAGFRHALAAGVRVAMGTDSGVGRHGQNLRELALLAECGMSAARALVSATSAAAELLGLDGQLGTLEPGKRADLVVVDGDPYDFATLGERIAAVYKDGRLVHGGAGAA
jgi:imidazolonepropionase-like amidohydrolase